MERDIQYNKEVYAYDQRDLWSPAVREKEASERRLLTIFGTASVNAHSHGSTKDYSKLQWCLISNAYVSLQSYSLAW